MISLVLQESDLYPVSSSANWATSAHCEVEQECRGCERAILNVDCQSMNPSQIARARYRVIFAKDAQELEAKLNDTNFVPSEYAITHLTFNSGRAEYLVILERD